MAAVYSQADYEQLMDELQATRRERDAYYEHVRALALEKQALAKKNGELCRQVEQQADQIAVLDAQLKARTMQLQAHSPQSRLASTPPAAVMMSPSPQKSVRQAANVASAKAALAMKHSPRASASTSPAPVVRRASSLAMVDELLASNVVKRRALRPSSSPGQASPSPPRASGKRRTTPISAAGRARQSSSPSRTAAEIDAALELASVGSSTLPSPRKKLSFVYKLH